MISTSYPARREKAEWEGLGSDEYYGMMVRLAVLSLDGDTAPAHAAVREAFSAMQRAWAACVIRKRRTPTCAGRLAAASSRFSP